MYVADLTDEDLNYIRNLNGTKTIKEITEILNIENKSNENLRRFLDRNNINYKFERKSYAPKRSEFFMPQLKQEKGLELIVGKRYKLTDTTYKGEMQAPPIKLRILKEYQEFYLGITETGYKETIHKQPNCYEIKEIK